VFEESDGGGKKKGCHWLFTSHNLCDWTEVECSLKESKADASIKFEPFVLHVQCCTLDDSQRIMAVAIASGFRNSGISIGKHGKIITAVRSTHTLEAPLTRNGVTVVSQEYIKYTVELANGKLSENFRRINLFCEGLQKTFLAMQTSNLAEHSGKRETKQSKEISTSKADGLQSSCVKRSMRVNVNPLKDSEHCTSTDPQINKGCHVHNTDNCSVRVETGDALDLTDDNVDISLLYAN